MTVGPEAIFQKSFREIFRSKWVTCYNVFSFSQTLTRHKGNDTGITENNNASLEHKTKDCSVTLTHIESTQTGDLPTPPVEVNPEIRCTGRKCTVKDYSKLLNYDDDDELDSKLPSSPVKHKRPTNLLWKTSRT